MPLLIRSENSPLAGERRERALELLRDDEHARMAGDAVRAEGFLTGRMLLRELASELSGLPITEIAVTARCPDCGLPHGRPTLLHTALFASISHAGDRTIAAVADRPVGIDIERRDGADGRRAAVREVAAPPPGADELNHWTAVEAVLKADGRGLRVDPRTVGIDGDGATLQGARYVLADAGDHEHIGCVAVQL